VEKISKYFCETGRSEIGAMKYKVRGTTYLNNNSFACKIRCKSIFWGFSDSESSKSGSSPNRHSEESPKFREHRHVGLVL
jgi:hypothetical protein